MEIDGCVHSLDLGRPFEGNFEEKNLVKRHHSFCLPKDFDISPFFEIIKPRPKKTF